MLGIAGLGLLAWALFSSRPRHPLPSVPTDLVLTPVGAGYRVNPTVEALAGRRMSKGIAELPREASKAAAGPAPIDSLIRLKGILDYGASKPAVAVFELPAERKTMSFQAGDKIGGTGAVLREVGETVVVEYERRRWKLTYKGAQELPATVGDNR
ncbi:MAG TPA: hypothetical protein VF950_22625 [Planctomycetota bacterium]